MWFAYSADRKGEHPRQHLKTYKGALQADAYAGFHHLYGDDVYEAACWAHARRKFHQIHVVHTSPITTEALARIGALYAIEEEIRGKPLELRREVRHTRASPLLDALRKWMEKALRSLSAKSDSAAAIRYALSRWRALTRYTEDGLLEIDNSAAERALRAVALGRKNFLFVGSDCGGERAAAMYSLIGFNGSERTVRAYVQRQRRQLGLTGREVYVPQSYDWGVEAQIDWYEAWAILSGERIKLQVFELRSMASGAAFHRAYTHATQQAFLEAHERAFRYFDGVFRLLRYDNLGSAVKKILRGYQREEPQPLHRLPVTLALPERVL